MRVLYCSLLALMTLTSCARAVVFTRCELYHELLQRDFPEDQLPDWVCLVENESARNTSALSPINTNGSQDFGLFQINNRYWCDSWNGTEGSCHVACKDLLDDDIDDDCECAHLIFSRQGFNAWHGWTKRCKDKPLPDLSHC
ncbi:lysozyme c-1-like [Schistocerca piceifrons]|uniref:lysozyme c-1-like n=1 Tax=Schistocerca piceifrons TaxID=274613 RepID=UPI001F5F820B|nr:lysozyme c-1-like [Schistocerca piceifrons]